MHEHVGVPGRRRLDRPAREGFPRYVPHALRNPFAALRLRTTGSTLTDLNEYRSLRRWRLLVEACDITRLPDLGGQMATAYWIVQFGAAIGGSLLARGFFGPAGHLVLQQHHEILALSLLVLGFAGASVLTLEAHRVMAPGWC